MICSLDALRLGVAEYNSDERDVGHLGRYSMRRLMIFLGVAAVSVGQVLGQEYAAESPRTVAPGSTAIEWLIAFVFLVACGVVAFKPTKRANLG